MKIIKRISYYSLVIKLIRFLGLKKLARFFYYKIFSPEKGILDTKVNDISAKYYVKDSDELRLVESVSGIWGEGKVISYLLKNINPHDCLLDVGANIGVYSIFFAKKANQGRVISFEPERANFLRLQENISLNNINNITVFKKALGSKDIKGKLSVGSIAGNYSLLSGGNGQEVEIVNGYNFFSKSNLPMPQVIKIDVEGYEFSVLDGLKNILSNDKCKIVCCEIHPDLLPSGVSEESIFKILESAGFNKKTFFRKKFFKPYHIILEKQ